jgi:hypothetical protein
VCGACGRAGPGWEDLVAGAGPAQRSARAAALSRLLAPRVAVTAWRGGYLVRTPTGAARPAATLDEVWRLVDPPGGPPGPAAGEELQAAVVRVSAAARAGLVREATFPPGPGGTPPGGTVVFADGRGHVPGAVP